MSDAIDTISRAKEVATGVALSASRPNFKPLCASKGEFDELLSSYYMFFHEELSKDVVFLNRVRSKSEINDFARVLKKLRTGAQHSGNPDAKRFYVSWKGQYADYQEAAESLALMLYKALQALAHNAVIASRNKEHSSSWKDIVSTNVSSVMLAVVRDFGLVFKEPRLAYMVRQVEQRLSVDPGNGRRQATVQEYCVQEIMSQHTPLPAPYFDVLDHLGLLGDTAAQGAILVAYSVAAIAPSLRGKDFLSRVEETWRAAAAY